jgi:Bacterial Ig-like domain/Putative metal-binding motif/von Willebrand factor type D domain
MRASLRFCVLAVMVLSACGDDSSVTAVEDAGRTEGDAATPPPTCEQDSDCDDGLFCNGEETCAEGQCDDGTAVGCDDGIECTLDQCSERTRECESLPPDLDGDGHYDGSCEDAAGKAFGDDCDDEDPLRFPGNIEYCDPDHRDEDCDPDTFGDKDSDDDGFPDAECCNGKQCGNDCDDLKAAVSPKATETCDLFDNDCDGKVDEKVAIKQYVDSDRDQHGEEDGDSVMKCAGSVGYSPVDDDCDDDDPERFKGQFEICDEKDNDCDGKVDEARQDAPWFLDKDKDGFGDATSTPIYSCERIPGRVLSSNDCDDAKAAINPAAAEQCDAVDNDCSGAKDFPLGINDFEDDDSDGLADAMCTGGPDCNDRNSATGKGLDEVCDNIDNDCDKSIDEDTAQTVWFLDQDGDGWGVKEGTALTRCEPIPGRAANLGDCDDKRNAAHPGATETCSGLDEDCDGDIDEATDAQCVLDDAIGICKSGACAVLSCFPGRGDCNKDADDGCECVATLDPLDDQPVGGCFSDQACQDGDFCNGYERCNLTEHQCYPGTPVNCAASKTVLQGDAIIRNSLDIAKLAGIEVITGRLTVSASGLKNLTGLESLRTIGGDLVVDGDSDGINGPDTNGALTALIGSGLSDLVTVGGVIRIANNPALTSFSLPSLIAAGGLKVENNAALTEISGFGALVALQGSLEIVDNPVLASVAFDALKAIGGSLILDDNDELDDPKAPKLAKLAEGEAAASLRVVDNDKLTLLGKLGAAGLQCVSDACDAVIEDNVSLCRATALARKLSQFASLSIVGNRFEDCADAAALHMARVRTYDGLAYTSQPTGEVILARSLTDTLQIQARIAFYAEDGNTGFPIAVTARVGNATVGLYAGDGALHVNGVQTSVSEGSWIDLAGGGRATVADGAYHVMWPDGSILRLRYHGQFVEARAVLSVARRGNVEGLWGTFDGADDGQLVTRTGLPLGRFLPFYTFYDLFIDGWRITQQESLFEYPQGYDTSTYTNRFMPVGVRILEDLDPTVASNSQAACQNAGVTNSHWLAACTLDVAATSDTSIADSFATLPAPTDVLDENPPATESEIGTFPPFTADPTDMTALEIKQVIPTDDGADVNVHATIFVYFDDEIDPTTVSDTSLRVQYDNTQVFGKITGELTPSGNSVLYFQPLRTLPVNTLITVTLTTGGILDDGGNGLATEYAFSFTTSATVLDSPSDLSFEDGTTGWSLEGDAALVASPFGSVTATHGTHMALISTEDIANGLASGDTSSMLTSGLVNVPQGATKLRFDWDFASEEFNADSVYDDVFTLNVSGPEGSLAITLATVNQFSDTSTLVSVPGMDGEEHTGWQSANIDISALGSPITLSFTVSDVGDAIFTSAAFIDNLRFQ